MESMIKPATDEPVMVFYDTYECLGYLDQQGTWHDWYFNTELPNVIGWTCLEEW